ncbi:MAG: hypothetical protein RMY34_15695 [Aulosira sp. DedQUE10]|nr:hypothetical protein [Aulosira sp. DedQUE10]
MNISIILVEQLLLIKRNKNSLSLSIFVVSEKSDRSFLALCPLRLCGSLKRAIAFHAPICDRPFSSFFAPTLRERLRRMRETKKRLPANLHHAIAPSLLPLRLPCGNDFVECVRHKKRSQSQVSSKQLKVDNQQVIKLLRSPLLFFLTFA